MSCVSLCSKDRFLTGAEPAHLQARGRKVQVWTRGLVRVCFSDVMGTHSRMEIFTKMCGHARIDVIHITRSRRALARRRFRSNTRSKQNRFRTSQADCHPEAPSFGAEGSMHSAGTVDVLTNHTSHGAAAFSGRHPRVAQEHTNL